MSDDDDNNTGDTIEVNTGDRIEVGSDSDSDTIASVVLDMLTEDPDDPEETPPDLRAVGILVVGVYAGELGEIRIVSSSAHRRLPPAASRRTAAALEAFWKSINEHVDSEHQSFGVASGLHRVDPGSKGSA